MFGPSDTSFYFSCDASEGIGTFQLNGPTGGVSFGPDRFGRVNRSLVLSGGWLTSPQPLSTSILPSGSIDRTVSMWIQCNPSNPDFASFLSYGAPENLNEYTLLIRETVVGFVNIRPQYDIPVTQFPVCDDKWHHVAVTSIKNYLFIFIDGILRLDKWAFRDSGGYFWDLNTVVPSIFYLGNSVRNNYAWSGAIDDIRIYQRALLPMEIVQLYKSNSTWTCPPGRFYRLPSSTACSICARDASPPINDFTSCTPSPLSGPSDTLLYLSFDADEGLDALTNSTEGFTFVGDTFGNPNGALQLINGAEISIFLPPSFPSGKSERSLLMWLRCSAPFFETAIIPADMIWTGLSVSALTGRITKPIDLSSYSNACICDGSWHHFALRYDGTYVSIFVDATFITRRRWVSGSDASYGTTTSYNSMKFSLKFNGAVDDVRIYGRSLPTTDISQIFRRNSTWACPTGSYSLPGSSSCGVCKSGSVVSSDVSCPAPVNRGPSDTSMYLSLDKFETYNAFSPRILPGLTWVTDRSGSPNSALHFSDGAFLASPDILNSSVLPISTSSFSASAWFSCSRKTFSKQGVLFAWGNSKCDESNCADGSGAFGNFFAVKLDPNSNSIGIQYYWEPNRGVGLVYSCPQACFNFYSRVTLCDGYWHHLAFVIKPTMTIEMYLDSSFIPVVLGIWGPEPFQVPQSHLILGAQIHGFPGVSFTGALDDFRIYDRDLSPTEISQIFNLNSTWKCPASSYRLPGSPACSLCSSGSIFVDDSSPCSPPSPPFDTSFYHSLSKTEGLGVFTIGMQIGLSWATNRYGIPNAALRFSGSVALSSPGLLNTSVLPAGSPAPFFTVSVWIHCRAGAMKEDALLLSWGGNQPFSILLRSSNNIILVGNIAGQRPFKTNLCDEKWHHVTIVHKSWDGFTDNPSGRKLIVYVDRTLESIHWVQTPIEPLSRINIGNKFVGIMSDLKIYNRVLSSSDLTLDYRNGIKLTCPLGGYNLPGSRACSMCVNGAMPQGEDLTCAPSSALGPSDTSFYLSFDEKESLGAFSVENVAGLTWVSDRYGLPNSALFFSGQTFLSSPSPLAASVLPSGTFFSFSVSLWLSCDASQMMSKVALFSWGASYAKTCTGGFFAPFLSPGVNKIYFQSYHCFEYAVGVKYPPDKELEPITLLCDQKWHHLVLTINSAVSQGQFIQISLFVDGKFEVSDFFLGSTHFNQGGFAVISPSNLMLGAGIDNYFDQYSYRGAMDDFRIYPRILSSSEVLSLYLPPLAPMPPPLLSDITAFVRVGFPGAADSTCNITRSCTTISAALSISSYNASIRGIALYSSSIVVNTPITLPSSLHVGFLFVGANSQPTTIVFSIASTAPCTLLSVLGDSTTLSNLVLDGTSAKCCTDALFLGGVFNYMDNIHFRNLNCSRSLLSTTIANPGRVAKNTSMEYPAIHIKNCSFVNNKAPIYVRAWDTPSVYLSIVTAHHTSTTPAAFVAIDSSLSLTIFDSILSGFSTGRITLPSFGSGVIPSCGAAVLVSNTASVSLSSSFISNVSAATSGGASLCVHGTISTVSLINVIVYNSTARDNGGSISIDIEKRGSRTSLANIRIVNATLSQTLTFGSESSGGALFISNAQSLYLENVIITNSSAINDGGAIALVDIKSVNVFKGHVSHATGGSNGGALYIQDCSVSTLSGFVASRNSAIGEGGAVSLLCSQPCLLSISSASFLNNIATLGGGGLSARSSTSAATLTLRIEKSSFRSNIVTDLLSAGGGLLCVGSSGVISVLDSSFDRNRAIEGGGALFTAFIGTYSTVTVSGSTFSFNSALVRGGGLMSSVTIISLLRNTFTSNTALVKGGGALVALSDLTLDSNVFRNNSVTQNGGGLSVESCVFRGVRTIWSPPVPTIVPVDKNWLPKDANGTIFINNSAGMSGGAVYIASCETQLSYLVLGSNAAGVNGGGIFIDSSSISDVVSLGPIIASSNMALFNGGAIAITRSSSDTSICSWPNTVSAAGFAAWSFRAFQILYETSMVSSSIQRSKMASEALLPMLSDHVLKTIPPFEVAKRIVSSKFTPLSKCPMPLLVSNTTFFSTVSTSDLEFSFPFALYSPGTVSIMYRNPLEVSYFRLDPISITAPLNAPISMWPNSGTCLSSSSCSTISGNPPIMSNFSSGHPAVYVSSLTSLTFFSLQRQVSTQDSFLFAIVASFDGSLTRRSFGSNCDTFIGSWNGRYGCLYIGYSWLYNNDVCAGPIVNNQVYVTVLHCESSTCNMWVNDILVFSGNVGNRIFPSSWSLNNHCETSSFLVGDVLFKRNVGFNESASISTYLCSKYGLGNGSSVIQSSLPSFSFPDNSGNNKTLNGNTDWPFTYGKGVALTSRSNPSRLPFVSVSSNITVSIVWSWDGSNEGDRILISSYLGNAYLAQYSSNSTIGFFSDGFFVSSGFVLEENTQYALTLVAQGSNFSLYVDGILVLHSHQGFNVTEFPPVFLGGGDEEYTYSLIYGSSQGASGIISDIHIWLRALTDREIALFNLVGSPRTLIPGSTLILNQIVSTPTLVSFEESTEGCNTTNTTFFPDVLSTSLPSPKESLPFACIFSGNFAGGIGGDVLFSESKKVTLSNSLSVLSMATLGGGSSSFDLVTTAVLSNIAFNGSTAGSVSSGNGGIKGSTGGALMISRPVSLSLDNISFSNCAASNGGGLWLDRLSGPISSDSISLRNISFSSNTAYYGGADLYISSGIPPTCINCHSSTVSLNSSITVINAATGPRSAVAQSSPYLAPFDTGQALVIVGSVPIAAPLLSISLLDAFGSLVSSDNSSICEVSGIRNDTQGIIALGFSDTYTSLNGIVDIFPFSVENGPGMPGLLSVKCTAIGETSRKLPTLYFPLATSIVTVAWTANTLALPKIYILPSTANEAYPPTRPLSVALVDNSGSTITAVSVRCSLSISSVVDSNGRSGSSATLVGNSLQSSTDLGIATFLPGIQASSNSTIFIIASCTWISGDSVSTVTPLQLHTHALAIFWQDVGSTSSRCSCGVKKNCGEVCVAAETQLANLSDARSTFVSNGTRWISVGDGDNVTRLHQRADDLSLVEQSDVPAALPSSTDTSTLQALVPSPRIAILQLSSDGSIASVVNQVVTCSLSIATDFSAKDTAVLGGLDRAVVSPIAALTGLSSAITENGRVSFHSIGIRGAGFGSAVPLISSCSWITGEVIVSLPLIARTNRLRTRILTAPPESILPSNPSTIFPWSPFPEIIVESCNEASCTNDLFTPFIDHSITCIASTSPSTGDSTSNNLLQLLGTSFTQVNISTGRASYKSLSASGPFGSSFHVKFSCMWVSGDAATAVSPLISFPLIETSWMTTVDVVPGLNGTTNENERILSSPPPSYALYNTPLLPLGVSLTFTLPNRTHSSSNFSLISENPENELVCRLGATVNGSPILITGVTERTASSSGTLNFPSIALMPAVPTSILDPMPSVILSVSCTARGNALPPLSATTLVQRLIVDFVQAPPKSIIPASVSQPFPFSPTVSVAILNATRGVLISESSASCTVTVIAEDFSPSVPIASKQITLLGTVRSPVNFGVATFPGLSINAPLGSSATLSFACTRNAGGIIFSATAVVIIEVLQAAWLPPIPSKWQLFNTPILTSAALLQFVPDPLLAWSIASNEMSKKAPGVSCSLMLESPSTSGLSIVVSSPGKVGASGLSDNYGILTFSLSVTGIAGRSDNLSALCSIAGQYFSTPTIPVAIEKVILVAASPPPTVWLPSFPGASTPFSPIPSILLVRQNGQSPVDAREAACQMSVISPNATVLDPPLSGYKLSTLISTRVDATGAVVDNETELNYLSSNTPILFKNALVQSNAFGLTLDMSISCQRSQGDTTAPYSWKLRIVDADVEYSSLPPSSIVSQTAFALQLRLFDKGAGSVTLELDNVTICVVSVTTPDPSILLQNGEARAIRGVVKFLGVTLAARSGFVIRGEIICSLGQLTYPTKLPWTIVMAPCEAGTAPAGGGGYTCAACPSSTYSDGGIGVAACTTCPSQGVSCAGGLLVLLPGFSRTQDGASTLDSSTELRPCWNVRGCWVNLNNTDKNRAANHTHGCLQGYSGPLCGVCSVNDNYVQSSGTCIPCGNRSFNLLIISSLPLVIMMLVVWISLYRKVVASTDSQVLLRILLTYFQTMGTLSSVYFARGTEAFRALFGFTTALGDSPLTLASVQCELRIPFYARFGITVTLPFTVVILVLITNVSALALKRRKHQGELTDTDDDAKPSKGRMKQSQLGKVTKSNNLTMMQYWRQSFEILRKDVLSFFISQAWVAPVIFVLNASYSSLTTTSFNVFNCMPYSVGGFYYLAQDLSVTCFDRTHNIFRGIAGLLIACFGAGFPLLFAFLLRRNRHDLHKPEVFERLGFLYDGYSIKRGWYAWESVTMVRKAGIVMIGSLIKDEYNQIFASVSLLVIALFLQANFQPYEKRLFNYLEGVTLVTVMLTQLISMFFLRSDSQLSQCLGQASSFVINLEGTTCGDVRTSSPKNEIVTTASLAIVNIVFLIGIFLLMIRMWLSEMKNSSEKTAFLVEGMNSVRNRVSSIFSQRTLKQQPLVSSISETKLRNISKKKILDDRTENQKDRESEIFTEVVNPLRDKTSKSLMQTRIPSNMNKTSDNLKISHSNENENAAPEVEAQEEGGNHSLQRSRNETSKVVFSPLPVVSESSIETLVDNHHRHHVLPLDWIEHSNDNGDIWYEHTLTGNTQWEFPHENQSPSIADDIEEKEANLDDSLWIHCEDDTGDIWYQNTADETLLVWELPEGHKAISFEEYTKLQRQ